jgi:hypothetical protein
MGASTSNEALLRLEGRLEEAEAAMYEDLWAAAPAVLAREHGLRSE